MSFQCPFCEAQLASVEDVFEHIELNDPPALCLNRLKMLQIYAGLAGFPQLPGDSLYDLVDQLQPPDPLTPPAS